MERLVLAHATASRLEPSRGMIEPLESGSASSRLSHVTVQRAVAASQMARVLRKDLVRVRVRVRVSKP